MVRVSRMFPVKEKTTWMSSLSQLMILLSPASTDKGNTGLNFKWLSWKTLLFSLGYFGLGSASSFVQKLTGFSDQLSFGETKSIIDRGSQFANFAVLAAIFTLPFFFTSGVPSVSGHALAKDLTSPKYGLVFSLGGLLNSIASILGIISIQSKHPI